MISNQRLDYEQIKQIKFSVAALAGDLEARRSDAHITLKLRDVNDNAPVVVSPVETFLSARGRQPVGTLGKKNLILCSKNLIFRKYDASCDFFNTESVPFIDTLNFFLMQIF